LLKDWRGPELIGIGQLRILRESFGVMSAVWRNLRILGSSEFSENLGSSGLEIVFIQRKRIREYY